MPSLKNCCDTRHPLEATATICTPAGTWERCGLFRIAHVHTYYALLLLLLLLGSSVDLHCLYLEHRKNAAIRRRELVQTNRVRRPLFLEQNHFQQSLQQEGSPRSPSYGTNTASATAVVVCQICYTCVLRQSKNSGTYLVLLLLLCTRYLVRIETS